MHFSGEESANGRKGYAMLLIFTGQQAFVFFKETTEGDVIGKAHLLRQFLDGDFFFLQQKFLGQGDPAAIDNIQISFSGMAFERTAKRCLGYTKAPAVPGRKWGWRQPPPF